jgi:hypothetical protein
VADRELAAAEVLRSLPRPAKTTKADSGSDGSLQRQQQQQSQAVLPTAGSSQQQHSSQQQQQQQQ